MSRKIESDAIRASTIVVPYRTNKSNFGPWLNCLSAQSREVHPTRPVRAAV